MSVRINSESAEKVISKVTDTTVPRTAISQIAARISFATSVLTLVLLAALHLLSPEFDPSWRMVSEYANGGYGWVLSLMFVSWAVSSWALAFTIWSQAKTTAGKVGLGFLIAAGVGEAMASVFDINHSLHGLSALIGIGSLPIAAMLLSMSLARTQVWSVARKALLWTANLSWISVLIMAGTFVILIVTFTQAGGEITSQVTELPAGVIALVGWANRLLIVVYAIWAMTVARQAIKLYGQKA